MDDRFRRLLLTLGPIIGALLLVYLVNMAVDTYSTGVEELRTERRAAATATAEAASAVTDTATSETTGEIAGETTAVTDTAESPNPTDINATEAITSILPPSVTEEINLDAAISDTLHVEGGDATGEEAGEGSGEATDTEATDTESADTETVTAGEEVTATETVTE